MSKNLHLATSVISHIQIKNEDGDIDFQEIKNAYNNKIEDLEVK